MAKSIVNEAPGTPEGDTAIVLADGILQRTAQIHAICRLAANADEGSIGKVLENAMWGVECLLDETKELVTRLANLALEKPPQPDDQPAGVTGEDRHA